MRTVPHHALIRPQLNALELELKLELKLRRVQGRKAMQWERSDVFCIRTEDRKMCLQKVFEAHLVNPLVTSWYTTYIKVFMRIPLQVFITTHTSYPDAPHSHVNSKLKEFDIDQTGLLSEATIHHKPQHNVQP